MTLPLSNLVRLAHEFHQPTLEVTEAEFDRCFNVNVKGIYFGTSTLLPALKQNTNGGSVINIASIGATRPRPGLVWYNSSKAAVWNVSISSFNLDLHLAKIDINRQPKVSQQNLVRTVSGSTRCVLFWGRPACMFTTNHVQVLLNTEQLLQVQGVLRCRGYRREPRQIPFQRTSWTAL